jgi:uncharacterized RDD family membrane protein YckC
MTGRETDSPITEDQIANIWRRVVGFLVDQALLVIITLIVAGLLGIDIVDDDGRLPAGLVITRAIASAIYYIAFTAARGQTPGKMLAGTRVVMERTGLIPSVGPSVLRWAVPGIPEAPPGLSVIGLFVRAWALVDYRNRGLHDKLAKTVVIRLDRLKEEHYREVTKEKGRGDPSA